MGQEMSIAVKEQVEGHLQPADTCSLPSADTCLLPSADTCHLPSTDACCLPSSDVELHVLKSSVIRCPSPVNLHPYTHQEMTEDEDDVYVHRRQSLGRQRRDVSSDGFSSDADSDWSDQECFVNDWLNHRCDVRKYDCDYITNSETKPRDGFGLSDVTLQWHLSLEDVRDVFDVLDCDVENCKACREKFCDGDEACCHADNVPPSTSCVSGRFGPGSNTGDRKYCSQSAPKCSTKVDTPTGRLRREARAQKQLTEQSWSLSSAEDCQYFEQYVSPASASSKLNPVDIAAVKKRKTLKSRPFQERLEQHHQHPVTPSTSHSSLAATSSNTQSVTQLSRARPSRAERRHSRSARAKWIPNPLDLDHSDLEDSGVFSEVPSSPASPPPRPPPSALPPSLQQSIARRRRHYSEPLGRLKDEEEPLGRLKDQEGLGEICHSLPRSNGGERLTNCSNEKVKPNSGCDTKYVDALPSSCPENGTIGDDAVAIRHVSTWTRVSSLWQRRRHHSAKDITHRDSDTRLQAAAGTFSSPSAGHSTDSSVADEAQQSPVKRGVEKDVARDENSDDSFDTIDERDEEDLEKELQWLTKVDDDSDNSNDDDFKILADISVAGLSASAPATSSSTLAQAEVREGDLDLEWLCEPEWNNLELELFWSVLRPHLERLLRHDHASYLPLPCPHVTSCDVTDCSALDSCLLHVQWHIWKGNYRQAVADFRATRHHFRRTAQSRLIEREACSDVERLRLVFQRKRPTRFRLWI